MDPFVLPEQIANASASFRRSIVRFLEGLVLDRPAQRRAPGVGGHLANRCGVGRSEGGTIRYEVADFDRAAAILTAMGEAVPMRADTLASAHDPRPFIVFPAGHHDATSLVAITMINDGVSRDPQVWFSAVPVATASAYDVQAVLVCETVLGLHAAPSLSWVQRSLRGRVTLAVFAGGLGIFRRAATRELLERMSVPVLRLGNFAPQSLLDAVSTPRLESLCWPPDVEELASSSSPPRALHAQLLRAAPALDSATHPAIASAWASLKRARASVPCDAYPDIGQPQGHQVQD